jgi:hypothetical protein
MMVLVCIALAVCTVVFVTLIAVAMIASASPIKRSRIIEKCPRCEATKIAGANFCRQCGMMLVSHDACCVWLMNQRDMLSFQRSVASESRKLHAEESHGR